MTIAFQGVGAAFATTPADPWNVPLPSLVQNHWILRAVLFSDRGPVVTPPAGQGWTLIQRTTVGGPTLIQYYKVADGTESGNVVFDMDAVAGGVARIDVFSGVDFLNPLVGTIQTGTADAAGNNAALVFPSLGGTIPAGAWIMRTAGSYLGSNTPHSHTPPSSPIHTELWESGGVFNAFSNQATISSSRYENPADGTIAGATGSDSANVIDADQTFAFRAGAGRGPRVGMIG